MFRTKVLGGLALLMLLAPAVRANNDIDQKAFEAAREFLDKEERGKDILKMLHMGASYNSHDYKGLRTVKDAQGKVMEGHFALVYRFDWEDDGVTDVAFLFDAKGNFTQIGSTTSNGILNRPFVLANGAIKLLGNLVIEAFKKKTTESGKGDRAHWSGKDVPMKVKCCRP